MMQIPAHCSATSEGAQPRKKLPGLVDVAGLRKAIATQ